MDDHDIATLKKMAGLEEIERRLLAAGHSMPRVFGSPVATNFIFCSFTKAEQDSLA